MKKILIINTVPFGMGGMSSVIVNYLEKMNKNDMKITMIVNSKIEKVYYEALKRNKVNIIILERNNRVISYMYNLYKIMKKEKFQVVHIHGNSSTMAFESIPAYLNKIPNRIVHSHNVSCEHKILNRVLWPILKRTSTLALACSEEAGKWLFKEEKEFNVLNNAIDTEKYKFTKDKRNIIRKELDLENFYVIGHVGYFNDQKNHEKLFKVVNYLKDKINVKLLCISGDSEVPESINELIEKYNLRNNIKILLRRNDVNELLKGMDLFMFPSKYEGLGLALIEAQASGLHCLPSNEVPREAAICQKLVHYCDLADCDSVWGNLILNIRKSTNESREKESLEAITQLKKFGYDIIIESEKLREIYINR